MSLYIMRHGKTDWNAKHKLQGRTDIPLNDEGRRMAKKPREKYKDILLMCVTVLRSSDAKETAEIVLRGRNIPVITDERLQERALGYMKGPRTALRSRTARSMCFSIIRNSTRLR